MVRRGAAAVNRVSRDHPAATRQSGASTSRGIGSRGATSGGVVLPRQSNRLGKWSHHLRCCGCSAPCFAPSGVLPCRGAFRGAGWPSPRSVRGMGEVRSGRPMRTQGVSAATTRRGVVRDKILVTDHHPPTASTSSPSLYSWRLFTHGVDQFGDRSVAVLGCGFSALMPSRSNRARPSRMLSCSASTVSCGTARRRVCAALPPARRGW
jgi:hypothetical protein